MFHSAVTAALGFAPAVYADVESLHTAQVIDGVAVETKYDYHLTCADAIVDNASIILTTSSQEDKLKCFQKCFESYQGRYGLFPIIGQNDYNKTTDNQNLLGRYMTADGDYCDGEKGCPVKLTDKIDDEKDVSNDSFWVFEWPKLSQHSFVDTDTTVRHLTSGSYLTLDVDNPTDDGSYKVILKPRIYGKETQIFKLKSMGRRGHSTLYYQPVIGDGLVVYYDGVLESMMAMNPSEFEKLNKAGIPNLKFPYQFEMNIVDPSKDVICNAFQYSYKESDKTGPSYLSFDNGGGIQYLSANVNKTITISGTKEPTWFYCSIFDNQGSFGRIIAPFNNTLIHDKASNDVKLVDYDDNIDEETEGWMYDYERQYITVKPSASNDVLVLAFNGSDKFVLVPQNEITAATILVKLDLSVEEGDCTNRGLQCDFKSCSLTDFSGSLNLRSASSYMKTFRFFDMNSVPFQKKYRLAGNDEIKEFDDGGLSYYGISGRVNLDHPSYLVHGGDKSGDVKPNFSVFIEKPVNDVVPGMYDFEVNQGGAGQKWFPPLSSTFYYVGTQDCKSDARLATCAEAKLNKDMLSSMLDISKDRTITLYDGSITWKTNYDDIIITCDYESINLEVQSTYEDDDDEEDCFVDQSACTIIEQEFDNNVTTSTECKRRCRENDMCDGYEYDGGCYHYNCPAHAEAIFQCQISSETNKLKYVKRDNFYLLRKNGPPTVAIKDKTEKPKCTYEALNVANGQYHHLALVEAFESSGMSAKTGDYWFKLSDGYAKFGLDKPYTHVDFYYGTSPPEGAPSDIKLRLDIGGFSSAIIVDLNCGTDAECAAGYLGQTHEFTDRAVYRNACPMETSLFKELYQGYLDRLTGQHVIKKGAIVNLFGENYNMFTEQLKQGWEPGKPLGLIATKEKTTCDTRPDLVFGIVEKKNAATTTGSPAVSGDDSSDDNYLTHDAYSWVKATESDWKVDIMENGQPWNNLSIDRPSAMPTRAPAPAPQCYMARSTGGMFMVDKAHAGVCECVADAPPTQEGELAAWAYGRPLKDKRIETTTSTTTELTTTTTSTSTSTTTSTSTSTTTSTSTSTTTTTPGK